MTRARGVIVTWNDERGYGFIRPQGGGRELFFHVSDVQSRGIRPDQRMAVTYRPSRDERGRPCAIAVRTGAWRAPAEVLADSLATLFLLALAALCATGRLTPFIAVVYGLMSLITLFAYRFDKARAAGGGQRIPERALHVLEFAGGWPGALAAQWHFHHKNRKSAYQVAFWMIVAANLAIVAVLVAVRW